MFTIQEIKTAHKKVKSGSDFPNYIKEIQSLGVTSYVVFVSDGRAEYYGENENRVSLAPKYDVLNISDVVNKDQFVSDLKNHQAGNTDYPTFCNDCAKSGIVKWVIYIDKMTCTYYDKAGNEILTEHIL